MEILDQLLKLIKSFFTIRYFQIKLNTFSKPRPIKGDVPQGSCLSSHLFSIYINDMPQTPIWVLDIHY